MRSELSGYVRDWDVTSSVVIVYKCFSCWHQYINFLVLVVCSCYTSRVWDPHKLSTDMGNIKGLHREVDGQWGESHEEGRVQPWGATKQLNGGETVDAQHDGAATPPVVWAVLRAGDRRLESMTTYFTNSMEQLSAQLTVKLFKDINDAFIDLMDETNKTRESTGQVESRVPARTSAACQHEEGGISTKAAHPWGIPWWSSRLASSLRKDIA